VNETELLSALGKGSSGPDVKRTQEWLTLSGFGVAIDGQFGPATELAVEKYQSSLGLPADGTVTPELFDRLVAPLKAALAVIAPAGRSLGALTLAYAQQHLAQRPREVGGNNMGPWVRVYMGGNEGQRWPWCAGFACFCLGQAAQSLGAAMPITPSYSCTQLAERAKTAGLFIEGSAASPQGLTPGCFFLLRGTSEPWHHVGIVQAIAPGAFTTVEGNSNENGSADGYEVCSNVRGWVDAAGSPRDFVQIA
jgi:hypothetical protein